MLNLPVRYLSKFRTTRWRYIITNTLVIILGLLATITWTTREIRIEANTVAVEKAKSNLRLAEALLDSRLPGPWAVREGQLYKGNTLINGNNEIVDQIGLLTGDTCTIFQGPIRIATNIIRDDTRVLGTRVSDEVCSVVLGEGKEYSGGADVAGIKYQTAYKPIQDQSGKIIGMLYVGANKQFVDSVISSTALRVASIYGLVLLFILVIIWMFTNSLTQPINELVTAAGRLSHGDLDTEVNISANVEIGRLANTFEQMRRDLKQQYSELQKANELLQESERRFREMLENVHLVSVIMDTGGNINFCNDFLLRLTGWKREDVLGSNWFDLFVPAEKKDVKRDLMEAVKDGVMNTHGINEIQTRNGERRLIFSNNTLLRDIDGNIVGTAIIGEDITERLKAEEELRQAHQRLIDIIEFLPDATFVIDKDRKVIAWNKAIEEMTGVAKKDILGKGGYAHGKTFYHKPKPILIDLVFEDNNEIKEFYHYVERKGNTYFAEFYVPSVFNGMGANLWASASPLLDEKNNIVGAIETIRDITERKHLEKQLQYLATHDALTNIANRYSMTEALKRAVAKAKRGEKSAFLFIDLDNFKLVNDSLGHAAGDNLLVTLTNILKNNLREGDLLARFGGDEFCVLLEGASLREAEIVAEKLRRAVDQDELYLDMHKCCLNLSISIGVVMVDGSLDAQKVLSYADNALYTSKESGRNRVTFLKADLETQAKMDEANRMVSLIRNALRDDLFTLYFQPVIRVSDGKTIHHEMLLRLQDEKGDIILPGRFIPAAERFGLMPQIDRWVVRSCLAALHKFPDLQPFINLSGLSLGDEATLEFIEEKILESGIDPTRIGFEITETAAVKDMNRAEHWIRRLKNLGCRFALDDFGIGFSSFAYLRMLPVDYLKIDGSYIRDLDRDATHRALVKAMNAVAHALGKKTIAEFVENEDIMNSLSDLRVDYGQGYYLGRPISAPAGLKQACLTNPHFQSSTETPL
ncbi:EAL domain-containing protein [Pelotomaculum propionicicum]|uniref:Cyclic di-GMP phosphodiesterase PdeB n=1 Tax=Pelotomaculum propionicicum TaxID=258475 RepID=A0A4Y7RLF4_9FIRM|nr:EAL domain-containing protein [Pelotomaculum propionicicum]TEB09656.1 Cyclic di-GMP phosphodiesterase PdeB [Pelotomaculum propionicicum]